MSCCCWVEGLREMLCQDLAYHLLAVCRWQHHCHEGVILNQDKLTRWHLMELAPCPHCCPTYCISCIMLCAYLAFTNRLFHIVKACGDSFPGSLRRQPGPKLATLP